MREQVFNSVQEIFRDIFDDEEMVIADDMTADDVDEWDSLEQILLLTAMEKKFTITFEIGEVGKLKNVGEIVDLIVKKAEKK